MGSSFQQRKLKVTITLASGSFGSSGGNVLELENMRVLVDIQQAGGAFAGAARVSIYGMLESDMNQLTTLALDTLMNKTAMQRNTIKIEADGVQVYFGDITNAWGDYQAAPDVHMHIEAVTAFFDKINPYSPTSYPTDTDVIEVMQTLANGMGLTLENNGVTGKISSPYLAGTAVTQAHALARAANIELHFDGQTMIIAPKGKGRANLIADINAGTGLIGYPAFDNIGVKLQCLFNPNVRFLGIIEVSSPVMRANGRWLVTSLSYRLESERPGGAWFMMVRGTNGVALGGK